MCLAIPGEIRAIHVNPDGIRSAEVAYPGQTRSVSLLFLPDAVPGDWILVQAGFGIRLLTRTEAAEVIAALEEGGASNAGGTPTADLGDVSP